MKRLIYAPKAYIFIRSSNMGGQIYDVSNDVVSGQVTQNLGDVSKASWQLRNRYQKWLRDPDTKQSIFLPMDMVTIWLQRVSGKPIQVFTGYLDTVPYYQGYPGNAIFEATCTLKKLAYTWFDPGLQFFQAWVMSTGGWTYDPNSGEAMNPHYLPGQEVAAGTPLEATGALANMNDGGFAELLGRFMVEVAGWDTNDVLISEMPKNLPKLAARLYMDINKQTEADVASLERFLGQTMGVNGWANPHPATPTTASGAPAQNSSIVQLIGRLKTVGDQNNIPIIVLAMAAFCQTDFDEKFSVDPNMGQTNWGYGIYALQPVNVLASPSPFQSNPFSVLTPSSDIDGKSPTDLLDADVATEVFCKRLNKHPQFAVGARNNDLSSVVNWIEAALGRPLRGTIDLTTAFNRVKTYCASSLVTTVPTATPATNVDPANISFTDPNLTRLLTTADQDAINTYYGSAKPWLAGIVWRAKSVSRKIHVTSLDGARSANSIQFTGPAAALRSFYNSLKGDSSIDAVDMRVDGTLSQMKGGTQSFLHDPFTAASGNILVVTQSQRPPSSNVNSGSGTLPSNSLPGSIPFQGLAAFSANAAFAANFAFPANAMESMFLTGDRALMNDVSCLDGVKQFCQASLRTFRSLPDGRFLAFYPDYFGAQRKPYWQIYNIEITNFGIQLNDESLATHVYVVGDTFAGDGQIDYLDEASTRGVATISQAFMLNSFIEDYAPPIDKKGNITQPRMGRLQDAYTFLQHYGARPYKEEQPLIRNTFYEFLMAWQRFMQLWSQQFATDVTFTFQPEVMAGGLIAFPDHDIQMFCQSVTHTFDYTSGFETSAVMTSPSLLPGKPHDRQSKPGFALAGNINTVGAAG